MRRPWEEYMPGERTPRHRSKHVKLGPSWLFHKGLSFSAQLTNCNVGPCWHVKAHIGACLRSAFSTFHSFGRWLQWFYQVLSFENSRNHRKTLMSTKACFCGKAFLSEPAKIAFGENKDANSSIKNLDNNSFARPWEEYMPGERTPRHRSKHVKLGPSWLFHKGLSFSAQLTNCNVGPCWHVKAHIGACLRSAFSTFHSFGRWLQWFYQVLSFENSPWANLGCCLRNHRKTLMSTKACFCGKAFLSEPAKITFGENKDAHSWIKIRLYNDSFAPALGEAYAGGTNTIALIQTS